MPLYSWSVLITCTVLVHRAETIARAEKEKVLLEAEARAEAIRLKGEALAAAQLVSLERVDVIVV